MSHFGKVQIGSDKAQHTETYSSPHTFTRGQPAAPTVFPDMPKISNIKITSAVAGLPGKRTCVKVERNTDDEENMSSVHDKENKKSILDSTHRVETMTFDVDHISPPIANMFRRLILTEVPVLAFDRILIEENDSVVPDELLSHRIGLIPLAGPVSKMQFITESHQVGFDALDPQRVLIFELQAEGRRDVPVTNVYSGDLKWSPLPGQLEAFDNNNNNNDRVFLVHSDIIITKLGPGQKLRLRALAVKGLGGVHAKWAPAAACFYELRTSIKFQEPIIGELSNKLQKLCPMGVFGCNESEEAVVVDVEKCTLCRECLRRDVHPEIADKIIIEKDKTRVRFTIESIGQLHAAEIFRHALTLFAERLRDLAVRIRSSEANVSSSAANAIRQSI